LASLFFISGLNAATHSQADETARQMRQPGR
jgi:hypothetical protein